MATESYGTEQFEAGSEPVMTTEAVIASGNDVPARTPLGRVTLTGKVVPWAPTAEDGSQNAVFMTAYAVDATLVDKKAQVIKSGCFNSALVSWPTATDAQKLGAFDGTPISHQELGE